MADFLKILIILEIKDLMIDPINADVEYAVLSFGGFTSIGSKLVTIPFEAFQFSDKDNFIRSDVNKEKPKMPPGLTKTTGQRQTITSLLILYTAIMILRGSDSLWLNESI